ncbi:hypothetical protein MYX82_12900 [Acidobacteria bacterium AH-259-D05]|nr:hypothetical protein [Acidobacteria bacterium AH-259-D05]
MAVEKLLAELDKYLSGTASLDELESWTVSNLQNTIDSKDDKAIAVIDELDTLFMQLRNGEINELVFIKSIDALVRHQQTIKVSLSTSGTPQTDDQWVLSVDGKTIAQVAIINEFVSEIRPPRVVFG